MPHKRAKRSVREQLRSEKGTDLPPPKSSVVKKGEKGDISSEAIPKSLARVLNAVKVRDDYKERKRRIDEDTQGNAGKKRKIDGKDEKAKNGVSGILPGESLQHYNKRVEASMRPLVRSAVQSSLAVTRNAEKTEREGRKRQRRESQAQQQAKKSKDTTMDDNLDDDTATISNSKPGPDRSRASEFETYSTSAPRRLNDIAQAPPQLKPPKVRGSNAVEDSSRNGKTKKSDGVLSMAQRHMMEVEREKAVKRYRELKAQREAEKDRHRDGNNLED